MRLDRFLAEMNLGTRTQVKELIRQKKVCVNGILALKPEFQIDPAKDQIVCQGQILQYEQYQYYLLHKPQGMVSATRDALSETVMQLLPAERKKDLFPVGRLDKDTEGLMLVTNDGALAHDLLSPKRHVAKTYLVKLASPLSDAELSALEQGVDIGDEKPTMPAWVTRLYDPKLPGDWIHLTIREGRFHQVKRMLEAVGNEVLFLKRIRFGALHLDTGAQPGSCRALSSQEVADLKASKDVEYKKRKLMEGKRAVIFDLDGSLVDSMWLWDAIDKEYLGRFGIEIKGRTTLKKDIEGMSFHETALYFKEKFPIPDSIEQMKADWNQMAWDKYAWEVPLKPGIPDFLEGCRRNGILLGIATSNSRELVENVLGVHHLRDAFSAIVTGSEVTKGKPAPDIYLRAAQELGVDPGDCLVFEDILPGLMAGKNAGMTICAVSDADSADTWEEKKTLADYAIENFYDFF